MIDTLRLRLQLREVIGEVAIAHRAQSFQKLRESSNPILKAIPFPKEIGKFGVQSDGSKEFLVIGENRYGPFGGGQFREVLEDMLVWKRARRSDERILDFFADRLKVQQREAGVRHDLIDAVFALGGEDDLVRLLARVKALQSFVATEDGANLLAGYKRAANILKKEEGAARTDPNADAGEEDTMVGATDPDVADALRGHAALPPGYALEPEEAALATALDAAEPAVTAAIEREDFAAAMSALASLRAPIDAFFERVTVNDPDRDKRSARLTQLTRIRAAMHKVADFSKIEG